MQVLYIVRGNSEGLSLMVTMPLIQAVKGMPLTLSYVIKLMMCLKYKEFVRNYYAHF